MIEIYKDIPGYENRYQVSNLGNICNCINNKGYKSAGGYIWRKDK
jgi:hypothetical protein